MLDTKNVIYKATNLLNGKIYIGLTTKKFKTRRDQHLCEANNPRKGRENVHFYNAIRKYGENNFKYHFCYISRSNLGWIIPIIYLNKSIEIMLIV